MSAKHTVMFFETDILYGILQLEGAAEDLCRPLRAPWALGATEFEGAVLVRGRPFATGPAKSEAVSC